MFFGFVTLRMSLMVCAQNGVMSEERGNELQSMISQANVKQGSGDYNQAVMLYNQAAKGYLMYGMKKQATDLFEKALKCSRILGNTNGILILDNQLGMVAVFVELLLVPRCRDRCTFGYKIFPFEVILI